MPDCDHDCSQCALECNEREGGQAPIQKLEQNEGTNINKVIAVVSGKGGVGKSSITSLLASISRRKGDNVAVMDADITGPSIPKAFGMTERPTGIEDVIYPVKSRNGINVMSINLILENETDPVVWRGPILGGTLQQFWTDVYWGNNDIMYMDMPPGTGDVMLSAYQLLPIDGIVIVTSPQELVGMIVEKSLNMADIMNVPVLGMIENMSYYKCPDCGSEHAIFGESRVEEIAKQYGIKNTARLPLDPELAKACDEGTVEDYNGICVPPLEEFVSKL